MPPGGSPQVHRIVVRHPAEEHAVVRQLVPLFARYLASLAADAHRGIGEESFGHSALFSLMGPWCFHPMCAGRPRTHVRQIPRRATFRGLSTVRFAAPPARSCTALLAAPAGFNIAG